MGKSIFELSDKFGYESPWVEDWVASQQKPLSTDKAEIVEIFIKQGDKNEELFKSRVVYDNLDPAKYSPKVYDFPKIESKKETVKITISVIIKGVAEAVYITVNGKKQRATNWLNNTYAVFEIDVPKKEGKREIEISAQLTDFIGKTVIDTKKIIATIGLNGNLLQSKKIECFCDRNFTKEEIKKIIESIRKNTFYKSRTIYSYYQAKLFSNEDQLPDDQKTYKKMTQVLNDTFKKFEINTCIRKLHFLAQAYWETSYFTRTKEIGGSLKYDPYRGRGFMQLTGIVLKSGIVSAGIEDIRTNNATSYLGYKKYSGIDVVSNPDLISKSIYNSADSGGWFWKYGKLLSDGSVLDLNSIADNDDLSRISFLVNGGNKGKQERIDAYNALKKIFDYENCINKK